jgi:hypothetical protein
MRALLADVIIPFLQSQYHDSREALSPPSPFFYQTVSPMKTENARSPARSLYSHSILVTGKRLKQLGKHRH